LTTRESLIVPLGAVIDSVWSLAAMAVMSRSKRAFWRFSSSMSARAASCWLCTRRISDCRWACGKERLSNFYSMREQMIATHDVDFRELTDLLLRGELLLEAVDRRIGRRLVDPSLPCLTTSGVSLVLSLGARKELVSIGREKFGEIGLTSSAASRRARSRNLTLVCSSERSLRRSSI